MKKPPAKAKPKKGTPPVPQSVEKSGGESVVTATPGFSVVEPLVDKETNKVIGLAETAIIAWVIQWSADRGGVTEVDVTPVSAAPTAECKVLHEPSGRYSSAQGTETWESKDDVIAYFQAEREGPKQEA